MKNMSENLKKLLQKIYHIIITIITVIIEKMISTISESVKQEEEICQCENIFNTADFYEKEIEIISEIHLKRKISMIKINKFLRLLISYLKF